MELPPTIQIYDVRDNGSFIWDEMALCEVASHTIKPTNETKYIILNTGKKEWILLENETEYRIEIDGIIRNMCIGKPISFDDVLRISGLENVDKTKVAKLRYTEEIDQVPIIYARCNKPMALLDPLVRKYALDIEYEKNTIYAIKSVAGSGKTTTLLNLAKENSGKKILYLAFNKSIVNDIRKKSTRNMTPYTFDAFIRTLFIKRTGNFECNIQDIKPYSFGQIYPWFKNKPFKMKQAFISKYSKFCKDTRCETMVEFIKYNYLTASPFTKKHLVKMWVHTKTHKLLSFDGLRKLAFVGKWFKDYIDTNYDMVFIDEAQDFDPMMLKMLLRDTTIPKIFVGDPRQAIYEWRGAVNTFDRLPDDAFVMEFYTTWRIGNPACDIIRSKFINCWMIAGNDHITELHNGVTPSENYDYLFRSWRYLLQTASQTPNIWINDYEKKRPMIEKLHNSLQKYNMSEEDKAKFEDDLPNFLLKLNVIELHVLLDSIQHNLVSKSKAKCRMYTVHAYKGMENSHIRIFNDIDHDEEENIYYVALTRGKDHIYLDDPPIE